MVAPLWPRGRLGDYIERGGLGAAVRGFAQVVGGGWRGGYDPPPRGGGARRPRQPPPTPTPTPTPGVGQTNPRVPTGPSAPPFLILDAGFFGRGRTRRRATRAEEERILREILTRQRGGLETCTTDAECEEVWRGLDPSPEMDDYNAEEVSRRILERGVVPYNPADDPLVIKEQAIPTRRLWQWVLALPKRLPRPLRRTPRRKPGTRPNPAQPFPQRGPGRRPTRRRVRPGQPVIPVPGPMFPGLPGNPPVPAQPRPTPGAAPTPTPRPAAPEPSPSSPGEPPPGGRPNADPMPLPSPGAPGSAPVPVPDPGRSPGPAPGPSPATRPAAPPSATPGPGPVSPSVPWPNLLPWPFPGARPAARPRTWPWPSPGTSAPPGLGPGLTPNNPPGVGYAEQPMPQSEPCRDAARQRKRKRKRKSRTVCYRGTYTELASGLIKRRKEKIPCRRSRKKPALRLVR